MKSLIKYLGPVAAVSLLAVALFAQNSKNVPDSKEAPISGIPPLPALEALGRGVFIRSLAEAPLAGERGFEVLPRIGHINITVDDGTRHEMVILFSLPPGQHKVLLELTDSAEKVVTSETVEFTLPNPKQP